MEEDRQEDRCHLLIQEAQEKAQIGLLDDAIERLHQAACITQNPELKAGLYAECANLYEKKANESTDKTVKHEATRDAMKMLENEKQLHILMKNTEKEMMTLFVLGELADSNDSPGEGAATYYKQAIDLAKQTGNKEIECFSLRSLGNICRRKGMLVKRQFANLESSQDDVENPADQHYKEAITYFKEALLIAKAEQLDEEIGPITGDLADCHAQLREYEQAKLLFTERLRIAEEAKDRKAMRRAYDSLGNIHLVMRDFRGAIQYYRIALGLATELGDKVAMGRHYMSLGSACADEMDFEQATDYYTKAIKENRECGNIAGECRAYKELGRIMVGMQSFPQAGYFYAVNRRLSKKIGDKEQQGAAHEQLYELKVEKRIDVEDGKLMLDSSMDPAPYTVNLSESLRSIYLDEVETVNVNEPSLSSETQSINRSVSSFDHNRFVPAQSGGDLFDLITRMSSRIDDQRVEMPSMRAVVPTGRHSIASTLSTIPPATPTGKHRTSVFKRVKSQFFVPKTTTPQPHRSSLLSVKSTKSLKSLKNFGWASSKSKSSLRSDNGSGKISNLEFSRSGSGRKDGDLFRVPEVPMKDVTNRRTTQSQEGGEGTSRMDHRNCSPQSIGSFASYGSSFDGGLIAEEDEGVDGIPSTKHAPYTGTPVAPPRKNKLNRSTSSVPMADTDETEDIENEYRQIGEDGKSDNEKKTKRALPSFPRFSITSFGKTFGKKKSREEPIE